MSELSDDLVAFQRRAVGLGIKISPGPLWRTHLCSSLAGLFAVTINKGERLKPEHLLADKELALVWFGIIAAECATEKIGESFERVLLAMPIWLFESRAVEQGAHVVGEVRQIHDRLVSGPAAGLAEAIASTFLDWTLQNDSHGIEVLNRHIDDASALVGAQRQHSMESPGGRGAL